MKRSKFSEAQIAFILRQAEEGTAVDEVCRKAGISEATSTTIGARSTLA
jgi:putative transposase